MTKDKDEWGNIELPGFGDDLLLHPRLNSIIENRSRIKEKNPRYGIKGEQHQFYGKKHKIDSCKKMAHPGKENYFFNRPSFKEENGFYGETHTTESRERMQDKALNRKKDHHCEHCNGDFTAQAYKQHHGDHCEHNPNRIVKQRKKMAKEICPHCGTEAAPKAFARLHGENCKQKLVL